MFSKSRSVPFAPLAVAAVALLGIAGGLRFEARAQDGDEAKVNLPRGRTAAPIIDGQYPASYFPNTELLGADEMRITALGSGMPNQTKAAVSLVIATLSGNCALA